MRRIEKVKKSKEGDGFLKQREREREREREGILKNVRPRMPVFWDVTQQC